MGKLHIPILTEKIGEFLMGNFLIQTGIEYLEGVS